MPLRTVAITAWLCSFVVAQTLPARVEGMVTRIADTTAGSELTVLGQAVRVSTTTFLHTPTATLTLAQLQSTLPLPGRAQPGFLGCTAIVFGKVDAPSGVVFANDVFLEPSENVTLGAVTANAGGRLFVNNMPVTLLTDLRIPARAPTNTFGFAIDTRTIAVGAGISVEGYHDGAMFRAFDLVTDHRAAPLNPAPQVAITRATVRENTPSNQRGDDLDIRGGVTTTHVANGTLVQSVAIYRVDGAQVTLLTNATATLSPLTPGFASWSVRFTTPTTTDPVLGRGPTRIRAINTSPGANHATIEVTTEQ